MKLDIRWPIGLLLLVLGAIMAAYGVASDPAQYARSLGHNINLSWGAVLVIVGGVMIALARRARA